MGHYAILRCTQNQAWQSFNLEYRYAADQFLCQGQRLGLILSIRIGEQAKYM